MCDNGKVKIFVTPAIEILFSACCVTPLYVRYYYWLPFITAIYIKRETINAIIFTSAVSRFNKGCALVTKATISKLTYPLWTLI